MTATGFVEPYFTDPVFQALGVPGLGLLGFRVWSLGQDKASEVVTNKKSNLQCFDIVIPAMLLILAGNQGFMKFEVRAPRSSPRLE